MDCIDTETISSKEMDVEEKSLLLIPGTYSDPEEVAVKENVSNEIQKNEAIGEVTITKQHKLIEILSVELVTPCRDQANADIKGEALNNGSDIICADIPIIEEAQPSFNIAAEKIPTATQIQLAGDATLGANTMETNDEDACRVQVDEKKLLNNSVELTANTIEIQCTTITKDMEMNTDLTCENIPVVLEEKQDLLNCGSEKSITTIQNQLINEDTVEANAMERNDVNIPNTQVENKVLLYSNPVEQAAMERNDVNIPNTKVENKALLNSNPVEQAANTLQIQPSIITSGLSLLAEYESDDDTDSVVEVPYTPAQDYRNQVVEINSDTDSDESTDSSDIECLNELRKNIEKRIEVAEDDEGEEEGNEDNAHRKRQPKVRVKGEMSLDDLPPIQDLQITVPEDECIELGKIHSIVDQLVLVSVLPNSILLDLETVLFLERGQKVLGVVFDVLGQVVDPLYCVRFNSNKQIKEKEIKVGDVVYVAPKTQFTQYVILSKLMTVKGSDASWENDVEPPPRFLDYSDDEQEQLARRELRNKDRPIDNEDPNKRARATNDKDDPTSSTSHNSNTPQRSRKIEQRNNRVNPLNQTNYRPRFDSRNLSQQSTQNNWRSSSWHSNYYPQTFLSHSPNNYGRHPPHYPQAYRPHMPIYPPPPPVHNMPYPPPYGTPPMWHQIGPQIMPNTFNIRPPVLHSSPNVSNPQQYTSTSPPSPEPQ